MQLSTKDLEIELAKELVSKDSQNPPGNETPVAEFIFDYLKDIGLNPEKQYFDRAENRFNVLVFDGNNPDLIINGHMDTVPVNNAGQWRFNPFGEISEKKLFGRGSADTKGQIAALLAAMTTNFNEKIVYAFNVEEETSLQGISKVLELRNNKLKNLKFSISLEPTDGKIMIGSKGRYTFEVAASGKTAHASRPWRGKNAIYDIAEASLKIRDYNLELNKITHPLFDCASISVGTIKGGTACNVVPDLATMEVDRRILPNEDVEKVKSEFYNLISPLKASIKNKIDACEMSKDSKIVREMQSCLEDFRMDKDLYGFNATSELSEMKKQGIEGIIFGTGELDQCHKPDEYITLDELRLGTRILRLFLEKWK